jgi:hypothetical protein
MIKIDIKNQRNKYLGMEGVLCYSINTFVWLKFVELLYLIVIFEKKRELTFIIKEPTKNSLQCANAIHKKKLWVPTGRSIDCAWNFNGSIKEQPIHHSIEAFSPSPNHELHSGLLLLAKLAFEFCIFWREEAGRPGECECTYKHFFLK